MKSVIVRSSVAAVAVVFAIGFGVAVVLAGQQTGQGSARPSDTYDPSKTQTLSGCLKPGTISGSFMLSDAVETKASASAKGNYALVGVVPAGVKLQDHVNHKVEVAGTIGEGSSKTEKTLNMHTFKMVAAKCS